MEGKEMEKEEGREIEKEERREGESKGGKQGERRDGREGICSACELVTQLWSLKFWSKLGHREVTAHLLCHRFLYTPYLSFL